MDLSSLEEEPIIMNLPEGDQTVSDIDPESTVILEGRIPVLRYTVTDTITGTSDGILFSSQAFLMQPQSKPGFLQRLKMRFYLRAMSK